MWLPLWTLLAFVLCGVSAHPNVEERLKMVLQYIQSNDTLRHLWDEHMKQHTEAMSKFRSDRKRATFSCAQTYTHGVYAARNVHELRPEDVSVVGAMGDSLTAGNGILANWIWDCLVEYRGWAWSIGGEQNIEQGVHTLPNMLKQFSPNLKGYSLGSCSEENEHCSQLNVAIAGNVSSDMPMQARELVRRIKSNGAIDYYNEWKLITLFAGGNDLCDYCQQPQLYRPEAYQDNIREALDILHAELPRTFVNLVEIFDITPLAQVSTGIICKVVTGTVCGCASDASNQAFMSQVSHDYQALTQSLINSGRYDTRDDFTVVLQPFFRHTIPPLKSDGSGYDLKYFSPDCFHFSEKGQYAAAKALWNNMIEPVGTKSVSWDLDGEFHCPHTHGRTDGIFRTRMN